MKETSQHHKSREQFQAQAANYGKSHILADTADVRELLALIPTDLHDQPALDIATGGGHCALTLAQAGMQLSVCDLTPAMVEQARNRLDEEGFAAPEESELIDAICPAESLPYPDASFALVSCRVAPHHFADPAAFVREAARVLRPDGYFLLIDSSLPDHTPEVANWLNQVERLRDPSHARLLDRAEWSQLVQAAGLQTLHAELTPFEQPDVQWYFHTANTSPENQAAVLQLIAEASPEIVQAMNLQKAPNSLISWTWQRLSLLAKK